MTSFPVEMLQAYRGRRCGKVKFLVLGVSEILKENHFVTSASAMALSEKRFRYRLINHYATVTFLSFPQILLTDI